MEETSFGVAVIEWCEKYQDANWLVNIQHCSEFEEKLLKIESGETEDYNEIIDEYRQQVDALKVSVGYKDRDELVPTEAMKNLLDYIAKEQGVRLGEDIYANYEKAQKIIAAYNRSVEKIGKCPFCKKAEVVLRRGTSQKTEEPYVAYACTSKECKFKIYDSGMERFFNYFRKETDEESRKIILAGIFKNGNKGYLVGDFKNEAGQPQEKTLCVGKDDYGYKLDFVRKKKI